MASEQVAAQVQPAAPFPWSWSTEWANPALQTPIKLYTTLYEEGLASASRFAKDQASHLTNLAECRNPSDVIVYQTEFLEKSLTAWFDESRRAADKVAKALATK